MDDVKVVEDWLETNCPPCSLMCSWLGSIAGFALLVRALLRNACWSGRVRAGMGRCVLEWSGACWDGQVHGWGGQVHGWGGQVRAGMDRCMASVGRCVAVVGCSLPLAEAWVCVCHQASLAVVIGASGLHSHSPGWVDVLRCV